MNKYLYLLLLIILGNACTLKGQDTQIKPGAYQFDEYLPMLRSKKIGLFVNHTALVGHTHLVDTLLSLGVEIEKVFSPEHGFKGEKADGELIENETTHYPFELISLYGASKKPTDDQLRDLDLLVIDIQDVGVRFYTYSSTMTYLMEACAKNNIPVLVLDRPNPNGSYIDGPMLDTQFSSFVGLHPIPLVHGLTLGEMATMINDEGWLGSGLQCQLTVVTVRNWDHSMPYSLPVKPSPNLPNDLAIALYPSLALFEGTVVSIGRGTDHPFQVIGHPDYEEGTFSFTPQPNEGSKNPPLKGQKCFGQDLSESPVSYGFTLKYLIAWYHALKGKTEKPFFNSYFSKLAGTDRLQQQIEAGWSEAEIRVGWSEELKAYRELRSRYLLYAD